MAEPILELTLRGADKVVAVACGKCRIVAHNREMAAACCMPRRCDCGAEVEARGWIKCQPCRLATEAEKEARRFAAARKIPEAEWDGPVFWDSCGPNDGYFNDLDELHEFIMDDDLEPPEYVTGSERHPFPRFDATALIDDALGDHWEGAVDHVTDVDELQAFLDAWVAKQDVHSFVPDDSVVVVLEHPPADESEVA